MVEVYPCPVMQDRGFVFLSMQQNQKGGKLKMLNKGVIICPCPVMQDEGFLFYLCNKTIKEENQ